MQLAPQAGSRLKFRVNTGDGPGEESNLRTRIRRPPSVPLADGEFASCYIRVEQRLETTRSRATVVNKDN